MKKNEEYTAIDLADIWEAELLPLCYRPKVVAVFEECMNDWRDENANPNAVWRGRWTLSNPEPAPWELSRTDYWCMKVDRLIEAAARDGDWEAGAYSAINICVGELNLSEATSAELNSIAHEIERKYEPQRVGAENGLPCRRAMGFGAGKGVEARGGMGASVR